MPLQEKEEQEEVGKTVDTAWGKYRSAYLQQDDNDLADSIS